VTLDEGGDPCQCPEFVAEAVGTRPLAQELDQVLRLFGMEFGLTPAGMRFGMESCLWGLQYSITPSADRTGRGLDMSGDFPHASAGCA
jgi:hypothetical protein